MRDPMGSAGAYDNGSSYGGGGGYGGRGMMGSSAPRGDPYGAPAAAAAAAGVGSYERRIGGAALPPTMYGGVSNQPALPAAGAPQMRQDYGGGMRNDPYYPPPQQQQPPPQQQPMAQPAYGGGAGDPYGQPAPYSYSTGGGAADMYSRRLE